ncbi:hypothetical protein C8R43DRAFT_1041797 [Mycena crocata]|nr:hypothetical protein C8R43DRAFT_1041797 [Mycena crocata]
MGQLLIADMPPEIITAVFSLLDGKSLISCSSVSRLWHGTVSGSTELQYAIELWAEGMIPGDVGTSTSAEKLEALRNGRYAWHTGKWSSSNFLNVDLYACRAYELAGGVLAHQQAEGRSFHTVSLPSVPTDAEELGAICDIGIALEDFQDFAIDPTQDLLAILYEAPNDLAHLEFRALSSQEHHPLAPVPIFVLSLGHDPNMLLSLHIADDVIAMFFHAPRRLIIYNWRAGFEIADLTGFPDSLSDFHFLSSRSYILAHRLAEVIKIYKFEGEAVNDPILVVSLGLPQHAPTYISSMTIHAGPYLAKPLPDLPFSKANESRIYMILMCFTNREWLRLFVHHRTLQKYVFEFVQKTPSRFILWDEWGPHNTRTLPGANQRWLRHVHGERVAIPCGNSNFVQILDFSLTANHPRFSSNTNEAAQSITVLHSDFSQQGVPMNALPTSLPYRSTLIDVGREYNFFLIDQDRLIGVMNPTDIGDLPSKMSVYTS